MANRPDDGELEDELWGNLLLKRSRGKSGYYGVYGPSKSKKRPFQAMIKSEKTGRQQGLGSFATAKEAAVRVATAIAQGEGDDLDSPRKQNKRGALFHVPAPAAFLPSTRTLAHATEGVRSHATPRYVLRNPFGSTQFKSVRCWPLLICPAAPSTIPHTRPHPHSCVAAIAHLPRLSLSQAASRRRPRPRRCQ